LEGAKPIGNRMGMRINSSGVYKVGNLACRDGLSGEVGDGGEGFGQERKDVKVDFIARCIRFDAVDARWVRRHNGYHYYEREKIGEKFRLHAVRNEGFRGLGPWTYSNRLR